MTILALLAFALGIGITTAVFSLFYGVLLKPLPYPNPDQLAIVYDVQPACATCPASYTKYIDWKTRSTSFAAMAGSSAQQMVVTGVGDPDRLPAVVATWTLPEVFGVAPALGRWFTEHEDAPGGPKVVVLSHGYWQTRFGGDPGALGRTLTIAGTPHDVAPTDPLVFAMAGALLLATVLVAVYLPARQASRDDPLVVLRTT